MYHHQSFPQQNKNLSLLSVSKLTLTLDLYLEYKVLVTLHAAKLSNAIPDLYT